MNNPQSRLADIAEAYIGVEESPRGSNCGPIVNKFKAATDLNPKGDWPWCMAAVSFWCQELGQKDSRFKLVPHHASVSLFLDWARKNALVFDTANPKIKPQRGDILTFKSFSHVGIVTQVLQDRLETVEGNTNADGGREGYAVLRRHRNLVTVGNFVRLPIKVQKA